MKNTPGGLVPDLNCDLGEGEPAPLTRRLMELVTSANISCGVHAGSPEIRDATIALAIECGVNPGAHPGAPGGFGRAGANPDPEEFSRLVREQVAGFAMACQRAGCLPSHVKLHGALYHLAEDSPGHRRAFAGLAREFCGTHGIRRVFAKSGGALAMLLAEDGIEVFEEVFLDRRYLPDGSLVPRGQPGDVITSPSEAAGRAREMVEKGRISAIDGTEITVRADTLCVHGDNPSAPEILAAVWQAFDDPGREGVGVNLPRWPGRC